MTDSRYTTNLPPEPPRSIQHDSLLYIIVGNIIPALIILVGTLSNILNLVVMARPAYRNSSMGFALKIMSAFTLLTMWTIVLSFIVFNLVEMVVVLGRNPALCRQYLALKLICNSVINWILVQMTVMRYISIAYPFKAKAFLSLHRMRYVTAAIIILCLVLTEGSVFLTNVIADETWNRYCERRTQSHGMPFVMRICIMSYENMIPGVVIVFFNILVVKQHKNIDKTRLKLRLVAINFASKIKAMKHQHHELESERQNIPPSVSSIHTQNVTQNAANFLPDSPTGKQEGNSHVSYDTISEVSLESGESIFNEKKIRELSLDISKLIFRSRANPLRLFTPELAKPLPEELLPWETDSGPRLTLKYTEGDPVDRATQRERQEIMDRFIDQAYLCNASRSLNLLNQCQIDEGFMPSPSFSLVAPTISYKREGKRILSWAPEGKSRSIRLPRPEILVVLTSCVFVGLNLPYTLWFLIEPILYVELELTDVSVDRITLVCAFFKYSNHAINCLLYSIFSTKFQQELEKMTSGL